MKNKLILMFALIGILSLVLVSSQYSLNNKNIPTLGPTSSITSSSSSGGNVTSVSSGDNCIFVSPTTGDVVVTFNTSCGGSGSGDGSFNITYQTFAYNQTTPALNYVRTYYYNKTEINSFNASWISTFNITYQTWAYNQTTAVFNTILLNNTISQRGVAIGFNSTYNATYAQFAYNQTIAINPFNQDLNTTNNPTFNNLTLTGNGFYSKAGIYDVDLSDPLLRWIRFTALGGTIEVADLNFALGAFLFQAKSNLDLYFGNDDLTAVLSLLNSGYIEISPANSLLVRNGLGTVIEANNSKTTIFSNLTSFATNNTFINNVIFNQNTTIKGNYHDWVNPSSSINTTINATGVNIISNHQIYYVNYSLDKTYKNTYGRPILLTTSFQIVTDGGNEAFVFVNKTTESNLLSPSCTVGMITPSVGEEYVENLNCPIGAGEMFNIISTTAGSSAIYIQNASVTLL